MDCRESESPIDSSRYSVASECSDNQEAPNTASLSVHIFENVDRDAKSKKIGGAFVVSGNESKLQTVDVKTRETTFFKNVVSVVVADDEEEIDVEGVDEGDPMWRPW